MALSRCLGSVALALVGSEGARVARKRVGQKLIAGVPVLNYDAAYGGNPGSVGELEAQVEHEWVVVVKEGTTAEQLSHMCKASKNACNLIGSPEKGGVPFLEMRGTETDLEQVIQSGEGAVKYVEPDNEVSMIPEFFEGEAATWGLNRIGADQRGRAGAGSTIFILDTGVRVSHREFTGRAAPALDMTSGSPVECNGDTNCARDAQGHGTHCAGTAGGETFGVAPLASVRSVKVLSDSGSGSWSWSYGALDWLATSPTRPAVASMSLGGSGTQQAMKDAVDAAVNSGVTVVVAGGNDNSDACRFSPAFVPSAITVGSTTSTDSRSSFSNYGSCTNIWAPGSSVLSASHTSDSGSRSLSGTSMACPHVAGGAAMVLETNPSMKASAVLAQLTADATKGVLSGLKSNDVNVLLYVGEDGAPPAPPTPTPTPPTGICEHEKNCDVSHWCGEIGFEAWCRQQGQFGVCPQPYCRWTGNPGSLGELEAQVEHEWVVASQNGSTIMATLPVAMSDCGGSGHVVRLVDYQPKSVQTGATTVLSVTGTVSEDISGGTMNMKVQMTGFPWTTLGQLRNGNICNPLSLELRSLGIYGGKLEWVGIACPVRAGEVTVDVKMTLAGGLPTGLLNTRTSLDGTRSDGKPLLCSRATTSGR